MDSTVRIIEFEIVNEPRLTPQLQDKVKKEIFGRYNSGITPLKRSEIDNAIYDEDDLSNIFKSHLKRGSQLNRWITELFFKDSVYAGRDNGVPIDTMMQFIRKNLVLHMVPITFHAAGKKNEIFERLYTQVMDTQTDHAYLFENFCKKIELISTVSQKLSQSDNPPNRFFYECLLWAMHVLENEDKNVEQLIDEPLQESLSAYHLEHYEDFSDVDYAFYAKVVTRYNSILEFFQRHLNVDLHLYRSASAESTARIKELMTADDNDEKIDQLESLRLNKPDPSRSSIEDIMEFTR